LKCSASRAKVEHGKLNMPKESTNPLPLYLREAFQQAVADYWGWQRGTAEPEVSLQQRRPCSISTVCSMVMIFDEAMPADIYQALYNLDTSTDELGRVLIKSALPTFTSRHGTLA
jgi:hypothetical protein